MCDEDMRGVLNTYSFNNFLGIRMFSRGRRGGVECLGVWGFWFGFFGFRVSRFRVLGV